MQAQHCEWNGGKEGMGWDGVPCALRLSPPNELMEDMFASLKFFQIVVVAGCPADPVQQSGEWQLA